MKINSFYNFNNKQTSFNARNPEISYADDIARRVNQCYTRFSSSLILDSNNINYFPELKRKLDYDTRIMRYCLKFKLVSSITLGEKLKAITDTIKIFKTGNCRESANLAEIAARTNGIKDCCYAGVYIKDNSQNIDLDHAVLLVKNKNKPYIIDAWLGFADYLPNAVKRYKSEFRHHFDLPSLKHNDLSEKKVKLIFIPEPMDNSINDIFMYGYKQEELKELYPELIIKQANEKSGVKAIMKKFFSSIKKRLF